LVAQEKHGINFQELLWFLVKPEVRKVAGQYIKSISKKGKIYGVQYHDNNDKIYCHEDLDINGNYQVSAESFDKTDWHYYDNKNTISGSDVVVDAGSADGLFSLSVVNCCKKIYIIEPNALFYCSLQTIFEKYIPHKAQLINSAVGDRVATVSISEGSLARSIVENPFGALAMITLDEIIKDKDRIDYIKAILRVKNCKC
jgi:hypothetical protein